MWFSRESAPHERHGAVRVGQNSVGAERRQRGSQHRGFARSYDMHQMQTTRSHERHHHCHAANCRSFTGGTAYFGRNDLDGAAMADGMAAARISYTLAFYLPDNERDATSSTSRQSQSRSPPRRPTVLLGRVTTRVTRICLRAKGTKELEASLLNQVDANGVGITATVDKVPGTPRGTLNIRLNLDPGTLSLKPQTSGWIGKVEETFVEVDETGATLSKVSDTKEFEVTEANRATFDSSGVTWPVSSAASAECNAKSRLSCAIRILDTLDRCLCP